MIDEIQRCLKQHQRSPTVQTPTEGFNVGIVPEGINKEREKVEKNGQKVRGFLLLKLQISMKIPKPFIPVHTCEPGSHQSISHTSQQNRVPLQPINLLCNRLNGSGLRSEQVLPRHSQLQAGKWRARHACWSAPNGKAQSTPLPPSHRLFWTGKRPKRSLSDH